MCFIFPRWCLLLHLCVCVCVRVCVHLRCFNISCRGTVLLYLQTRVLKIHFLRLLSTVCCSICNAKKCVCVCCECTSASQKNTHTHTPHTHTSTTSSLLHIPASVSVMSCVYLSVCPLAVYVPVCVYVCVCVRLSVCDIWCQLSHPSRSGPIIRDNNNNSLKPRAGTVELIGSSN